MLTANKLPGFGFGKDMRFEVTAAGSSVGTINDTRSTFELDHRSFTVTRSGVLGPTFQLKSGDALISTAIQKPFFNHYTVAFGDRQWTFKAIVLLATRFGLFEHDQQIGTIASGPFSNRVKDITADLPDDLPRELQMFLLTLFISRLTAPD
jgi:hypothetical protein